jgi:hypothetical protein
MQHFLKPAVGPAWAEIVPAQFLEELFIDANHTETRA